MTSVLWVRVPPRVLIEEGDRIVFNSRSSDTKPLGGESNSWTIRKLRQWNKNWQYCLDETTLTLQIKATSNQGDIKYFDNDTVYSKETLNKFLAS